MMREFLAENFRRSDTAFEAYNLVEVQTGCTQTLARAVILDDAGHEVMLEIMQRHAEDAGDEIDGRPRWDRGLAFLIDSPHQINRWISTLDMSAHTTPCGGCPRCLHDVGGEG